MDELFSHLSALREIDRRADIARQAQLNAILTRLEAIESRLDHLSNGGLRDSLLDAVPVLLQNAGLIKAETVKGKTEVIVALISVLSALGGAVIARWF
jgi:Tfp pilus assembly PilM family ATPase